MHRVTLSKGSHSFIPDTVIVEKSGRGMSKNEDEEEIDDSSFDEELLIHELDENKILYNHVIPGSSYDDTYYDLHYYDIKKYKDVDINGSKTPKLKNKSNASLNLLKKKTNGIYSKRKKLPINLKFYNYEPK